jgi:hypothetical protein
MRSILAALRSLVLPFNAVTGTRIVLDGINGVISVFNSTNREAIRIDSATSTETITGNDGSIVTLSGGLGTFIGLTPPPEVGTPWTSGKLQALKSGSGTAVRGIMRLISPMSNAGTASLIDLTGGSVDTPTTAINMLADVLTIDTVTTGSTDASINGNPIMQAVGFSNNPLTVGPLTAETVTDTITVNLIAGRLYRVTHVLIAEKSAVGSLTEFIRENALGGTILSTQRLYCPEVASGFPTVASAIYSAVATASKTFVGTLQVVSGGGTFTKRGSGTAQQSYMYVERIG